MAPDIFSVQGDQGLNAGVGRSGLAWLSAAASSARTGRVPSPRASTTSLSISGPGIAKLLPEGICLASEVAGDGAAVNGRPFPVWRPTERRAVPAVSAIHAAVPAAAKRLWLIGNRNCGEHLLLKAEVMYLGWL